MERCLACEADFERVAPDTSAMADKCEADSVGTVEDKVDVVDFSVHRPLVAAAPAAGADYAGDTCAR